MNDFPTRLYTSSTGEMLTISYTVNSRLADIPL